jgi:hypothetical protein
MCHELPKHVLADGLKPLTKVLLSLKFSGFSGSCMSKHHHVWLGLGAPYVNSN